MKSALEEILINCKNYCGEELTGKEYVSAYDNYSAAYSKLLEKLPSEDINLLIEIDGCLTQIDKAACKEKFVQGFKIGFRFALELLKD